MPPKKRNNKKKKNQQSAPRSLNQDPRSTPSTSTSLEKEEKKKKNGQPSSIKDIPQGGCGVPEGAVQAAIASAVGSLRPPMVKVEIERPYSAADAVGPEWMLEPREICPKSNNRTEDIQAAAVSAVIAASRISEAIEKRRLLHQQQPESTPSKEEEEEQQHEHKQPLQSMHMAADASRSESPATVEEDEVGPRPPPKPVQATSPPLATPPKDALLGPNTTTTATQQQQQQQQEEEEDDGDALVLTVPSMSPLTEPAPVHLNQNPKALSMYHKTNPLLTSTPPRHHHPKPNQLADTPSQQGLCRIL